jgi:hypothetical protein
MVFSLFANVPVTAMAAEQDTPSSSERKISETDAFWRVDGDTLIISGTGDLVDYMTRDFVPWKNYQYKITTVQIGYGITRLGNWNFAMRNRGQSVRQQGKQRRKCHGLLLHSGAGRGQ